VVVVHSKVACCRPSLRLAQLRATCQSLSPDLIILDPLVALCANGNMNDNASMSLVMRGGGEM